MNVPNVMINRVLRQYAIFFAGVGAVMLGQRACENSIINNTKAEIITKYPDKYAQINEKAEKMSLISKKNYLSKALIELDDSARIADAAQKAYFEGAQMVRDSIAKSK